MDPPNKPQTAYDAINKYDLYYLQIKDLVSLSLRLSGTLDMLKRIFDPNTNVFQENIYYKIVSISFEQKKTLINNYKIPIDIDEILGELPETIEVDQALKFHNIKINNDPNSVKDLKKWLAYYYRNI